MISHEQKEILNKLIERNGEKVQIIVAIEELSELIHALTRHLRECEVKGWVTEEMGDVYVVMEQLKIIFDNGIDIHTIIQGKIDRTARRFEIGSNRCQV